MGCFPPSFWEIDEVDRLAIGVLVVAIVVLGVPGVVVVVKGGVILAPDMLII